MVGLLSVTDPQPASWPGSREVQGLWRGTAGGTAREAGFSEGAPRMSKDPSGQREV